LSALAERMSHYWPTLLRIHLLAAHPFAVGVIAVSILLSLAMIAAAAVISGGLPLDDWWRLDRAVPVLWERASWVHLLAAFAGLTAWWAIVGGAITRWMARAILSQPPEAFTASLRFCSRWALVLPSLMASACFILILAAPISLWSLLPVVPIWLLAGFLYGALTTRPLSLREAMADSVHRLRSWRRLANLQLIYLCGFAASTGTVYVLVACLALALWAVTRGHPWLQGSLLSPLLLYALGYTTANLKSLQIYLYSAGDET
jgi:hypothetical protein